MANVSVKENSIARNQGVVRAPEGFLIGPQPPNALMLHYTQWNSWSPTVASGTDSGLFSSVGTIYKRVGNQVHVLLNIQFVYDPPGAPTTTITLGGLPLVAAAGTTYDNNVVMDLDFTIPPTIVPGALRIDPGTSPTELVVENSFTYVAGVSYTVQGEIIYLTDSS